MNRLITIDGDTAAGKGTLARRLAANNELYYLGTGQFFRTMGHLVLNGHASDAVEATRFFEQGTAVYNWNGNQSSVLIEGVDITTQLEDDVVAVQTSHLARDPQQQGHINGLIREFGHGILQQQGLVSEGRNTATALFPEHDAAFYVTADVAIRARRRFETHQQDGRDVSYDQVLQDMIARDERDKTRTTNPLAPAPDAVILDTSELSIEAALHTMQQYINLQETS
jgi:cytidylate kinase